jgi:hypothetical protein
MKKHLLLIVLLIILSGCAFGVYDSRTGFQGAVIGVPYPYTPYYSRGYYGEDSYGSNYRSYPYPPGRDYGGPRYHGYYR